ncbi:MAG: DUF2249 domain-containing protein [Ilumatobacteraceae bacterium]
MSTDQLDLRPLPPRDRHSLIFSRLDGLAARDTLRLVNDHDPKPLRYQLDAERPDQFRWEVIESGPDVWVIDITSRARVVDARPILAGGEEPFATIMDAADAVGDDEILVVYAPFEPVPLQGVLTEQGFRFVSDQLPGGDWRTTFLRPSPA